MAHTSLIEFAMLNQSRRARVVNPCHRARELVDRFIVHGRKAEVVWTKLCDVRVVIVGFPV